MSSHRETLFVDLGIYCNNRCYFCVVKGKKIQVLNKEKATNLIKEGAFRNINNIVFSGGESTLRPYLLDIINFAKTNGYLTIQVQTNGRTLSNISFVQALACAGATEFSISIHGHNSDLHEKITRTPNSFQEAIFGIRNIFSVFGTATKIITNTVITNDNLAYLSDIIQLLAKQKIPFMQLAYLHGQGDAAKIYKVITPRMSTARKKIIQAIQTANRLGYSEGYLTIEAYPYCFLRGYEGYSSDVNIPKSYVISESDDDLKEFIYNGPRVKTKSCYYCNFNPQCLGPWRDYPEHYGWSEFAPIMDRYPKDCIPGFLLNS